MTVWQIIVVSYLFYVVVQEGQRVYQRRDWRAYVALQRARLDQVDADMAVIQADGTSANSVFVGTACAIFLWRLVVAAVLYYALSQGGFL